MRSVLTDIADSLTAEARVQELINATSLSSLQGMVIDGQIPAAIMRDAEFTAASCAQACWQLTATEVNDIFVGPPSRGRYSPTGLRTTVLR